MGGGCGGIEVTGGSSWEVKDLNFRKWEHGHTRKYCRITKRVLVPI